MNECIHNYYPLAESQHIAFSRLHVHCLSFMHSTHHLEPPLVHLAIDEVMLDVEYVFHITSCRSQAKGVKVHGTECYDNYMVISVYGDWKEG